MMEWQKGREDHYRLLIEVSNNVGEGIGIVDENEELVYCNPAFAALCETPVEDMLGKSIKDFFDADLHSIIDDETEKRRSGEISSYELPLVGARGTRKYVRVTVTPRFDEDGSYIGAFGAVVDITERKALEEQVIQSHKLESIGHLAAGIAHEINSPTQYIGNNARFLDDSFRSLLKVVTAFRGLLEEAEKDPSLHAVTSAVRRLCKEEELEYLMEEIPRALRQSLEGITRVANIVAAMKGFSHPGSGEKESVDLNRAIETTVTVARNEWKYVADMELELDEDLPPVPCLPAEFNQIILNIVTNSAHAIAESLNGDSGRKGVIAIRTTYEGEWAEIRIRDTGTGIPEDIRTKIYDPFFTTKDVGKGTGQGLSIARDVVVNKLSGSIGFETETGGGTTFIIRLPTESPSQAEGCS